MKFPVTFKRRVGGSGSVAVLGTDTPNPTIPLASTPDNMLSARFSNVNGWPCHRIAVTYLYTGAGTAPTLPARVFMAEENTNAWYQVGGDQTLTTGTVAFFDVVALLDQPTSLSADQTSVSSQTLLQVDKPTGAADGTYTFCMGPDLTTSP